MKRHVNNHEVHTLKVIFTYGVVLKVLRGEKNTAHCLSTEREQVFQKLQYAQQYFGGTVDI